MLRKNNDVIYGRYLLKIFKGISVIMLSKVFEAETNGFSLTILKRKKKVEISSTKI
jgi:hypothetical protein